MVEGLELFLPQAYICSISNHGQPLYVKALALKENIDSYFPDKLSDAHQSLIDLCLTLTIPALEKSYNTNNKKTNQFTQLFQDVKLQKIIQKSINNRMIQLFEAIRQNHFFLTCGLEKGKDASGFLVHFREDAMRVKALFSKTQTGLRYQLSLLVEGQTFIPQDCDLKLICDEPGLVLMGNNLFKLTEVNSFKLKPFLKNISIFIPQKTIKSYIQQFVVDIISKIDVEVEGIQLTRISTIVRKEIQFSYDFFKELWMLELIFYYEGGFQFKSSEASQRRTKLHFVEEEIEVIECKRDAQAEQACYKWLGELGFEMEYNQRFSSGSYKYSVINKVVEIKDTLKKLVEIPEFEIEGKPIFLGAVDIVADAKLEGDWFDVKGSVDVGGTLYPIAILFENIKNENPWFKLKDDSYVLIPPEIMAKFENLVRFGHATNNGWRINKTQFTILEPIFPKALTDFKPPTSDDTFVPSLRLKTTLRPYQLFGCQWLVHHRNNQLGACLADDMGLGKTIQTLAALCDAKDKIAPVQETKAGYQLDLFNTENPLHRNALHALIILPATLVFNWYNEIKKYTPSLQVIVYRGQERIQKIQTLMTFDIILTTYQTVISDYELLKAFHFQYIILDESQQIKNKDSKSFKYIHQLKSQNRISLSGTPIENTLADLWSQMEFINPSILGSYAFFKKHFQTPIEKEKNPTALAELKSLVDPFILRRTKEQVAHDLPELNVMVHYSEMSSDQTRVFNSEKSAARNALLGLDKSKGSYKIHVLSSLMKLRQISNHPILVDSGYQGDSGKFEDVKNQILTIIKAQHKVLIFSSFVAHLDLYGEWLEMEKIPFVSLTGQTETKARQKSVEDFQTDEDIRVFLISIKAGGTGLNLTQADYVFILDPWWNPFVEKQAIARAHRIGQEKQVMVVRFISKGSIEEKIITLQDKKKLISDSVIDVDDLELMDEEMIEALFE